MTPINNHQQPLADERPIVRLRAMEPEDLDLLYTIENDRELWSVGSTNVPYSRFALHQFMEQQTGDIYTDRQVRLMIVNEQDDVVGMVDLMNFNPQHLRAEVGIVVRSHQRGQGHASAALKLLEQYARQSLHLHQLYAVVAEDNNASLHLFQKLGYQSEGMLRHWICEGSTYQDAVVMQKLL